MALGGSFLKIAEVHFACADRHHRSRFIRSVTMASKYLKFSLISVTCVMGGKDSIMSFLTTSLMTRE